MSRRFPVSCLGSLFTAGCPALPALPCPLSCWAHMAGPLCLLSWDRLGLGGQGAGMWAEGVAAAAAASGQEPEVPKREVRKRGGVLRVRWADASSPSRGFLGTAVGRVSQLCWFAGSESKSDDIVGSGLLPRCSPHEGPALGSIDSQPSFSPAPLGGKGSSPSRYPPLGLCPPGLASVFSHKTAMITTANIFSFFCSL